MNSLALERNDYTSVMSSDVLAQRPKSARRMTNLRLGDVQVVLAESRTQVRTGLKGALAEAGLRNIVDVGRIKTLTEAITQAVPPDVVICDTELAGEGGVCEMVRKVRHKEIGSNPFLCIIAVTWNPTADEVDRIIACGVDALLAAPFAPQQIIDRIDTLIHNRKPFLVTSDYVGPDRRHESDLRKTTIPMLEAPNSLRAKAMGDWDLASMRDAIVNASGEIKNQQVERQAADIAHITEQVIAQSSMAGPDMSAAHLDRLRELLKALDGHAEDLELVHLCELCRSARKLVQKMGKTFGARREKDLQLLHQMSLAIVAGATPRAREDKTIAHSIAKTVNNAR